MIGAGTYGKVFRAVSRVDGRLVAIKKVKTRRDAGVHSTTIREIGILKQLHHPHIVRHALRSTNARLLCGLSLLQIIPQSKSILIVMEHMECDLRHFIAHRSAAINDAFVKVLATSARRCEGLSLTV